MTTLSKEDIVRMDSESGLYVYHNGDADIEQLQAFATLARADLVAENERLEDQVLARDAELWGSTQEILALKAENGRLKSIPMKYSRMAFNAKLQDEADKLHTALAAAEAREGKLRAAIDVVLSDAEGCEDHDGWLAYLVSCEAIHQLDEAFSQPRDDSALREMIAGVYEECAKECDSRADKERKKAKPWQEAEERNHALMYMQNADQAMLMAQAIRALAEKKTRVVDFLK